MSKQMMTILITAVVVYMLRDKISSLPLVSSLPTL
jgi:hypothetical protein